jgi:hypothetical protein
MKTKLLTIGAVLCTVFFANAQQEQLESEINSAKGITFSEGDLFLEGSLKISTSDDVDFYAVNPKVGYFLNEKVAVGGQIGYSNYKQESTNSETDVLSIGAFARYYFLELDSKRFKAYGEAGLGFGRNTTTFGAFEDKSNSVTADINVGLNYFITKNIAATFTLANVLSYNSVSPENGESSNTLNVNINLFENIFNQPQFGLLYRF